MTMPAMMLASMTQSEFEMMAVRLEAVAYSALFMILPLRFSLTTPPLITVTKSIRNVSAMSASENSVCCCTVRSVISGNANNVNVAFGSMASM